MQVEGTIFQVLPAREGQSARGPWKAQDFVLQTTDQFTRKMVFSVFGEERLKRFNIQEGQYVSVSFDIDAHEYQGRWFNSVRAYDVRPVPTGQTAQPTPVEGGFSPNPETSAPFPGPAPSTPLASSAPAAPATQDSDDLPF